MPTAAIYARFSSDLQKDKSIEDQVALCREICDKEGLTVAAVFDDRGLSGASIVNRPGFQAMMRAAARREFDVLVTEDVDRIARRQADFHSARDDLQFLGIGIRTPGGAVSQIDGSLRALMSEMFLDNLAAKVRRGLRGVLRDGRHPGGLAYGYRPVPGKPGELAIVEEQAAIVREIFARYVAGEPPRQLAIDLNARGIAGPRGGSWNASTINGNFARCSGMLLNDLYIGRITWNRLHHRKDPATGRRVPKINPAEERVSHEAPQLRIIDDATWAAAQARKLERHTARKAGQQLRRPRMLSGLIKCGSCGAGMGATSRDRKGMRLQCSAHKERGTCSNGRLVYRDLVEQRVVDGLRGILADRPYLEAMLRGFNDELRASVQNADRARAQLTRRAGEIEREISRAVDAIVKDGADSSPLVARMRVLEAEKVAVSAELARAAEAPAPVSLHPGAVAHYRAALGRLGEVLTTEAADGQEALIAAVRAVVTAVTVHAAPGGGPVRLEIQGRLAELTEQAAFAIRSASRGQVVAGARNSQRPTASDITFRIAA
jgi:site-specific DNA recombinase